jgi:hypothetical protein
VLVKVGFGSAQTFTDSNLPIVLITTDIDPGTSQPYEIIDAGVVTVRPSGTRVKFSFGPFDLLPGVRVKVFFSIIKTLQTFNFTNSIFQSFNH